MSKAVELRRVITAALLDVHPRVYYEHAPDDAVYPYLVYDFPDSVDDGSLEQIFVDVDGWDRPEDGSTEPLETMMAAAHEALQGLAVGVDDQYAFILWRDNRHSIRDDDPRIRRRQYVYQARTYERRMIDGGT